VTEIDTLLGGWERVTAGYLLDGPAPVLVETGSQSSVAVVLEALEGLGLGPDDLAGVAVTHIHLDHAGGVGDLARAFPKAKVYVHELGARHLADPTRLVASAARVYGPLLDELYGRLDPTAPERLHVLLDDETIDLGGGRTLTAIDSPGHAKHHLGFHDSLSGLLFAGDAVGVQLPDGGSLRPATPPPDFDLALAVNSLHRFADRQPAAIALAHYGIVPGSPADLLAGAEETLRAWAGEAALAFSQDRDIAEALEKRFAIDAGDVDPEVRKKLDTLNGFHSNAAGFRRWLEKAGPAPPAAEGGHPHAH
jgi:glyoxylase-like metal-dependent hydrolase (beta-lactamase superfamily II)